MAGRTPEERLDRLEDLAASRGITLQSITGFQDLVVKPLVEQVKGQGDEVSRMREEMASQRGAMKMLAIVGSALATILGLWLLYLQWRHP